MPDFVVDFSDVQDQQIVPQGWYDLEVVEVRVGKSQSSGTPMLTVQFAIAGGEYNGRGVFDNLVIAGDGRWKTKQFVSAALGAEEGAAGHFTTDQFTGARVTARITHRVWTEERGGDGEPRARIVRYKPFGEEAAALFDAGVPGSVASGETVQTDDFFAQA